MVALIDIDDVRGTRVVVRCLGVDNDRLCFSLHGLLGEVHVIVLSKARSAMEEGQ